MLKKHELDGLENLMILFADQSETTLRENKDFIFSIIIDYLETINNSFSKEILKLIARNFTGNHFSISYLLNNFKEKIKKLKKMNIKKKEVTFNTFEDFYEEEDNIKRLLQIMKIYEGEYNDFIWEVFNDLLLNKGIVGFKFQVLREIFKINLELFEKIYEKSV